MAELSFNTASVSILQAESQQRNLRDGLQMQPFL